MTVPRPKNSWPVHGGRDRSELCPPSREPSLPKKFEACQEIRKSMLYYVYERTHGTY
jgi:hypothetical protein